MQQLQFGSHAATLMATHKLPLAATLAEALIAGHQALQHHPLADRDKVCFSQHGDHYVGFIAGLAALEPLLAMVPHAGKPAPVIAPGTRVVWQRDDERLPVTVELILGLKQKEGAPDTRADRPLPKPEPPANRRQFLWLLLTFGLTAAASFVLDRQFGQAPTVAGAVGLLVALAVWSLLQGRLGPRVVTPVIDRPEDQPFWDVVRALATRQLRASALPGEWVVAAIPRGVAQGMNWAPVVALALGLLATAITWQAMTS